MHPASAASLRVASASFAAVMKMTGHFDPMPQVRAQLDPRNSSEVDFGQQAGCRLRAAAFEQRLRGGERSAFYAVVCQQPRHAPQKARIVNRPRSRLSAGLPYLSRCVRPLT